MVATLATSIVGCGGVIATADDGGSTGSAGGTAGAGGGSAGSATDGGFEGLPCDVGALLQSRCIGCHRNPPTGGAPNALTSRADLLATSSGGQRYAELSLARMKNAAAPMPPGGLLPATEVARFEAWVTAGLPVGTCNSGVDAGMPAPLTCMSTRTWADRYDGSPDMNPGLACRACHAGQNFNGQNPQGQSELGRQYWFAGTAFPGRNERDGCLASPPTGVTIEILDADGGVRLSIPVRTSSGNFYDAALRTRPPWLPYTARVKRNGAVVSTMRTPQMSGDCNTCHTERGDQGAPGRITW
ncbi:MAG: hypothetical protein MUC96_01010 [Myxococcaceae bacterium]|jgi:hypothetical protein|nr:hypothetical protein [Myxococcaceae bacterium]